MNYLLILLALTIPTIAQATLKIYPSDPGPGSMVMLVVESAGTRVEMEPFFDQTLRFYPMGSGLVALMVIPLDAEGGEYSLLAQSIRDDGNIERHRGFFAVRYVERPVDRLQLPKQMVEPKGEALLSRIETEYLQLKQVFSELSEPVYWQCFSLPVEDEKGSPFGVRRILNGIEKSPHGGVDFRSPRGRSVKSTASGRVVLAADLYYTGNTVVVDHGGGFYTLYAHLDGTLVQEGELVTCGQTLGSVGSTGRSTGPHLHWGAKFQGVSFDPLSMLGLSSRIKSLSIDIEP